MLLFYTSSLERIKIQTALSPSQLTYESLQSLYSDTLQCACSDVSMSYDNFTIHLNVSFHPVCASDFVSEKWFTYFNSYNTGFAWWLQIHDFREWGALFFQLLQSFCSLANSTVNSAAEEFRMSPFITFAAMPPLQFQVQVDEALRLFQKSTTALFARPLQLFRASDQGNALISLVGTNWQLKIGSTVGNSPLLSIPITYNNGTCSCATSSLCSEPAAFYNLSTSQVYIVDGVFFGCSCLESILLSSLSCFFSESCTFEFIDAMSRGIPSNYWNINKPNISSIPVPSSQSHFKVNDTVETIVNRLFIDTWSNETSYQRYYNACAPSHCTYSYRRRLDISYVVTTFLSVFNGLSIGLHVAAPYAVRIASKIHSYFGT